MGNPTDFLIKNNRVDPISPVVQPCQKCYSYFVRHERLKMKRGHILAILAVLLIAVVSLLTLHLYRQGEREVLSRFQEQQSLLAAHLAAQIESFFESRSRILRILSSQISSEERPGRVKIAIDAHARQIDYVRAITLYDDRGKSLLD